MSTHSTAERPCPCLSNHEMDDGQRCEYLLDGKCRFFDGSVEENHLYDDAENKEDIGPRLSVAVPFTYVPQVFDTISPYERVHLIPSYDRLMASGDEYFWDALERTYALREKLYGLPGIPSAGLEEEYEMYQYRRRQAWSEPVMITNGHCRFPRVIFDKGFRPGPFPGFDLYTKNGRFITKWEARELIEELYLPGEPLWVWVSPLGYESCPVTLVDIFQREMRRGCFDRETYKKMVGVDDWDSDEDKDDYSDI